MQTAVLILSGGQSRRMGRDKSQLKIEGLSLLQWQQQRFQRAGFPVFHSIKDNYSGYLGPLAGIEAAVSAYPEISSWLVIPVDMPSLSVEVMNHLLEASDSGPAVSCYSDQPFPLFIQDPKAVLRVLRQWLEDENGRRSVRALIKHFDGLCIDVGSDQPEFNNINTPEQWRQFIEVEVT